jgi:arsenate reductase
MAEGFLQSLDNRITVRSAGTNATGKLNPKAVEVMKEAGIDISHHTSKNVDLFLNEAWDYVITVCGGAKETCPMFTGRVNHRVHIGFEDPSEVVGTPEFIDSEYRRIRDEIKTAFQKFYDEEIKPQL